MKNLVMIVVPVYKEQINDYEMISLRQLRRVLGHYPICFVAPNSLILDYDGLEAGIRREVWNPEYFTSMEAYSRLLMSREFYDRFSNYEYIFIYQLDGFVFSDKLREFCQIGYDYIGSPIPRSLWPGMPQCVGNGGVSLRRVQSMLKLLSRHDVIQMPKELGNRRYCMAEDAILSYWLASDKVYRIPSTKVAADFALDQDIQHRFSKLSDKNLPFACHGWQRATFPVWKKFIEAQGYDLSGLNVSRDRLTIRMRAILEYLMKRLYIRRKTEDCTQQTDSMRGIVNRVMPCGKIAVWGYGRLGQKILELLENLGVSVEAIYDEKVSETAVSGIKILKPCRNQLTRQRHLILITSSIFEKEIVEIMESWGLLHGWDYMTFEEFFLQLGREYLSYLAFRTQNKS